MSPEQVTEDEETQTSRETLCEALVSLFRESGNLLWVGGRIVGSDRVSGESPFGFGDDANVGLATVAQTAGELSAGAVAPLGEIAKQVATIESRSDVIGPVASDGTLADTVHPAQDGHDRALRRPGLH